MASATLNLKINKWTKAVIAIIKEYRKLEDSYIRAFDDIIYYTENSSTSSSIQKNVDNWKSIWMGVCNLVLQLRCVISVNCLKLL